MDRAALVMHGAAVVVGVLTAVFVVFVLPLFTEHSVSSDSTGLVFEQNSTATLAERFGFGAALLALIPTGLAVLPLLLPRAARPSVAIANAILMTLFSVVSGFTVGGFYVPMAVLMWAAVFVPWRVRNRRGSAGNRTLRIIGGIVIALPVLLVLSGRLSGAILGGWPLVFGAVLVVSLGVLFALGFRLAYLAVALLGAVIMVLGLLDAGFLMLALWWFGGVWLALGLSAVVATTARFDGHLTVAST